uniref:Uncharacterized protein n=1 Tax=Opuntia streptacantha TaxID=393608 RepID=A0A7C9D1D4_OPUST
MLDFFGNICFFWLNADVIIMSLSSGFSIWVIIIVNCTDIISLCVLILDVVWPLCFYPPLESCFDSIQGPTLLLKLRNCFIIAQIVKSRCYASSVSNPHSLSLRVVICLFWATVIITFSLRRSRTMNTWFEHTCC